MTQSFTLSAMAVGICVIFPGAAVAQTAKELAGTWTMAGNINITADGKKTEVFGSHGTGLAIFGSNGRFAVVNINPDTPKFAANSRAKGTPEENKAAMLGGIGLYGTYSVVNKEISMKVEGSTYPNWTGTDQKRTVKSWAKDQFTWSLPASIGGTAEVTWKRLK